MTKPIDHAASPLELVLVQHNMVHPILVENDLVEDILVQHIMVQAALPGGGSIIWRR